MHRWTLFTLCLAFLAAAGGAVGLGMALGALTFVLGVVALVMDAVKVLTR